MNSLDKNFGTTRSSLVEKNLMLLALLLYTMLLPAQPRLDLAGNKANFNLHAEAIIPEDDPICNLLKSADTIGNAGLDLQQNGDYFVSREAFRGIVGGSCPQNGQCAVFLKVHGVGSRELIITWQTIAIANFNWGGQCDCDPTVHAQGNGLTIMDLSFKIIGDPPGGAANIKYTLSQHCRVFCESEALVEDLALVSNQINLNDASIYQGSVWTNNSPSLQVGIDSLVGELISANGDEVSIQIKSNVLARIEDPAHWGAYAEDHATAQSYGSIKLELTTTSGTADISSKTLLSAPMLSPNPTHDNTTVSWNQEDATEVSLSVFDLLGRPVAQLACGFRSPGGHQEDLSLADLVPGVYLLQMRHFSREGVRQTVPQRLVIVE